jgi:hypothetical protein
MPETASLEPFEQTPEESPALTPMPIEQTPEESPAFTPIPTSQEDVIPGSTSSQEDAIAGSAPLEGDAINRVSTSPGPNGGPLGCCFGVVVGLVLSLSIAIASRLYADQLASLLHGGLSITVRIVMALVACAAAILFGYLGWKIGKRIYREYELSPKQQQRLDRLQKRHGTRSRVSR